LDYEQNSDLKFAVDNYDEMFFFPFSSAVHCVMKKEKKKNIVLL